MPEKPWTRLIKVGLVLAIQVRKLFVDQKEYKDAPSKWQSKNPRLTELLRSFENTAETCETDEATVGIWWLETCFPVTPCGLARYGSDDAWPELCLRSTKHTRTFHVKLVATLISNTDYKQMKQTDRPCVIRILTLNQNSRLTPLHSIWTHFNSLH
jgi:hypothetical protein